MCVDALPKVGQFCSLKSRPLFIQVLTGLVLLGLYILFVVIQASLILISIGVVAVVGIIASIIVLASELRSSKIP
jgi:hypothetical protein